MVEEYNENELKTYKEELLKEIKKQNKDFDFFKLIIIILLIMLIGFCIFNFLYKEKNKSEKRTIFFKCIEGVEDDYVSKWNNECKVLGRKDNCTLPINNADKVEQWKKEGIEMCRFLIINDLL